MADPILGLALELPSQADVIALIEALDAYQQALYPPESNHLLDMAAFDQTEVLFAVARTDGAAVGCGAAVMTRDGAGERYGEIKRMMVDPAWRGQGLGYALLGFLEAELIKRGIFRARLETGVRQPAAQRLYVRSGYCATGPFGDYVSDPLSLFFAKDLTVGKTAAA
ncbi:MAG: GNAT family N-acetyltransferase [Caldilineaceae bacterium]|nr:GNAT family N-acetyltransferase [Caldilineaceae bacterium]